MIVNAIHVHVVASHMASRSSGLCFPSKVVHESLEHNDTQDLTAGQGQCFLLLRTMNRSLLTVEGP